MSPPQKAAILRKELSEALDAYAEKFVQYNALREQARELEDRIETVRETAYDAQDRVRNLRVRLKQQEAQCNLQPTRPTGAQVDTSPEAQMQRHLDQMLSIYRDTVRARKGVEAPEDQVGKVRQAFGLA